MPYLLDGKCVYKKNADGSKGELRGCSDTVELAKAHLRALYAHETTKELAGDDTFAELLFEKESSGEAAGSEGHGCYLVTDENGGKHLPTCKHGKHDHRLMAAARAALTGNYRGHAYQGPDKTGALAKLKRLYESEGLAWSDKELTQEAPATMLVEKDANDEYRWILFTSSAFEDREGEIVSEKALEADCAEMELTQEYGEHLWYHCDGALHEGEKEARPYIPIGPCDFSFVDNKINIETGTFYDPRVAQAYAAKANQLRASKSFYYPPAEFREGVYHSIRTKERSTMFAGKESNLLTRLLFWQKEKAMASNEERITAFKKLLDDEKTADAVLAQAKELSAQAGQFLKSKEAHAGTDAEMTDEMKKKKKKMDEEDTNKEAQSVVLAVKELKDGFALALKEAVTPLTDSLKAETEKANVRMDKLEQTLTEQNKTLGLLLGLQPKSFQASKEGARVEESKLKELQEDFKSKLGASEKQFNDGTNYLQFLMEQSGVMPPS